MGPHLSCGLILMRKKSVPSVLIRGMQLFQLLVLYHPNAKAFP